jgi:hypothetical protein
MSCFEQSLSDVIHRIEPKKNAIPMRNNPRAASTKRSSVGAVKAGANRQIPLRKQNENEMTAPTRVTLFI